MALLSALEGYLTFSTAIKFSTIILMLAYFFKLVRKHNRLKHIPGDWYAGWTDALHALSYCTDTSYLYYANANKKHGSLVRIGINDLVTDCPEILNHMNTVRSTYTRGAWYYGATRLEPGRDHIFSEIDEKKHTKRRQQMASGYSGKENLMLETSIDRRVEDLIRLIQKEYISTSTSYKPVDFAEKIQWFTVDVITDVGFGQTMGNLGANKDVWGYIKAVEETLTAMSVICGTGASRIMRYEWIARRAFPTKGGIWKTLSIGRQLVSARFSPNKPDIPDMIDSFKRRGLSEADCATEAFLQLTAGSDTTATALRGTFLNLLTHPSTLFNLRVEIDAAVREGRATYPVIKDEEAKALPYLQAVIKEGLRIFPPVTDAVPKVVPPQGDTVPLPNGTSIFLPGGTNVAYNALGVHHSPTVYAPDPKVFRPERWLEANPTKLAHMLKVHELTFGYGRYQCLGKGIALLELNKVVFELVKRFEFGLLRPENPWKSRNKMGLWAQKDMWMRIEERA